MCWLILVVILAPWKAGASVEDCLHQISMWARLWGNFLMASLSRRVQPSASGVILRQVGSEYIRKVAKQVGKLSSSMVSTSVPALSALCYGL